jgi:hypothetical protein
LDLQLINKDAASGTCCSHGANIGGPAACANGAIGNLQ